MLRLIVNNDLEDFAVIEVIHNFSLSLRPFAAVPSDKDFNWEFDDRQFFFSIQ